MFNPEILTGSPNGGVKQGWGAENKQFSGFNCASISQKRYDIGLGLRPKLLLMTNRKLHMYAFDWHHARSMTLNCYKFKFSRNFVPYGVTKYCK